MDSASERKEVACTLPNTGKKTLSAFLLHFARLALSFHKIGGGSEVQNEKLSAFLLHFARLALSLRGIYFLMNENIV